MGEPHLLPPIRLRLDLLQVAALARRFPAPQETACAKPPPPNGQHWSLDVLYGQDRCRTRHKNGAENLAWVRKMALALLRHDGTKGTVPTKQFRAALDDDYRAHLLDILSQESA